MLYTPADFDAVCRQRDQCLQDRIAQSCRFEVVNETTLHTARRLLHKDGSSRVLALNFASARHPGGGFLKGSQAQEESLARASALYPCINQFQEMYDANRQFASCLYTDHMVYSPDVPVFRDDDDNLVEPPSLVSFITAPAVNAGAVKRNEPEKIAQIEAVMLSRIDKVLSLAVIHGHDTLVLGAWGCGVFANDPKKVARWFAQSLMGDGQFSKAFRKVVFAVLDNTPHKTAIRPFAALFGTRS